VERRGGSFACDAFGACKRKALIRRG